MGRAAGVGENEVGALELPKGGKMQPQRSINKSSSEIGKRAGLWVAGGFPSAWVTLGSFPASSTLLPWYC